MPNKYALIIGNTEYTDAGLAQLSAPGKDAEDFARALKSVDIEVVTLVNENASNLNEAIEGFFTNKKPDDLLVFYFSGHGVRDESGSLFLAVKNTSRSRLRSTAIKTDFVRELMDQSRSRRQVIILDCCNSGAFARGTKAETGGAMGMATTFEGTGYGRVVLTATDSTQFAWEGDKIIGDETANSLFTHFLVKGLEGDADEDGDGKITVDELYDYAYEQIVSRTPKQTPGKWSYKQQGEIVLRQTTKIENIKPAPLPVELIAAIENTIPYVREGAIRQLENFLKGKNLRLARSAREALEKIATEDDSRSVAQLAKQILAAYPSVDQVGNLTPMNVSNENVLRLSTQKVKEERVVHKKAEREAQDAKQRNIEIYDRSYKAAFQATQNFLPKLKTPALILLAAFIGYLLWQSASSLTPAGPAPDIAKTETPTFQQTLESVTPTMEKTANAPLAIMSTSLPYIGERILGIDVSYWDAGIDWSKVKNAGVYFASIKVTEGITYKDATFGDNWAGAKSAGILRAPYHFFRANVDPTAQAEYFIQAVKTMGDNGELPPVLDLETSDGETKETIIPNVKIWLDLVEQGLGRKPVIYTAQHFLRDYLSEGSGGAPAWAKDYPLWISQYPSTYSNGLQPSLPIGWTTWVFWEYTDQGVIDGINANVNMNVFNGSLEYLYQFSGSHK